MSDDITIEELNMQTKRELEFQVKESQTCQECKTDSGFFCYNHGTRIRMLEESLAQKTQTQKSET